MNTKLVIAEKPSVAQSIAAVLGASKRCDGYLEGNDYLVSWCFGHLAELTAPENYDPKHIYVKQVLLNNIPLERTWINHKEIANGGNLTFIMAKQPQYSINEQLSKSSL